MNVKARHPDRVRVQQVRTQRGMTILEVTLAMALLGFIIMAMFSAFGFAGAMSKREQQRLGAAELSSALIVQYLDEKTSLPTQQPIDYGPWKFRFHVREDKVGFLEAKPPPGASRAVVSLDRLKQVTITVWLSEESGGSFEPDGDSPQVVLTRVVDPLALRNPDSFANMMSSDAGRRSLTDELSPGGGGGGGARATTPGGSKSQKVPNAPKNPSTGKGAGLPSLETKK